MTMSRSTIDPVEWTPKARQIFETASRLFYERGISAVGVDTIAAASGVTKRTLYDRFGSKERLVVEYLSRRDADWRDFLTVRLAAADPDARSQLGAVFDASAAWSLDRSDKGCSMVKAHAEISEPDHPAYPVIVGQKRWMLALFRRIAAAAGAEKPDDLAAEFMLLHEGALVAHGLRIVDEPIRRARDLAVARLP